MLTRTIVAVLIVLVSALAPAGAEPRGENRGRAQQQRGRSQHRRGRGWGWGREQRPDYGPLGSIIGGIFGGWLAGQGDKEDEEDEPRGH